MKQFLLVICGLGSACGVFALDSITLQWDSSTGSGWQAKGIVAQWHWLKDNQVALTLDVKTLTLAALKKPLQNLRLKCQRLKYNVKKIVCSKAKLRIGGKLLDKPTAKLSLAYYFDSQYLQLNLDKLALAKGDMGLTAQSTPAGWLVVLNVNGIRLKPLLTRLNTLIDIPSKFIRAGNTQLKIILSGEEAEVRSASITGQVTGLNFSDVEGIYAGEEVTLTMALNAKQNVPSIFQVQGKLTINHGNLLIDPIYIEVPQEKPVTLAVDLVWQPQRLKVHNFAYTHTGVTALQGEGEFAIGKTWDINRLSIQSQRTSLEQLYKVYLQDWLETDFEISPLTLSGMIKVALEWDKKNKHFIAQLYNVALANQPKSFDLTGLDGKIQWHNNRTTHLPSHLRWSNIYLAEKIELEASFIGVLLNDDRIKLLVPWYQPLLGGAIFIEQFYLERLGKEDMFGQLQGGRLYPISLPRLSTTLDWPTLKSGQIVGKFPSINYRNQQLEIAGELQMDIFDGNIVASHLSLSEPFSSLPQLKANIEMEKINLEMLTDTITEFGAVHGLLSGYVRKLHLINWQPISFDAHFATPSDDTKPHKISQKAINNISSLGGGGAVNAISLRLLQIFENFYYRRIGWGCQLKANGVCTMHGVEPAPEGLCKTGAEPEPEGYYIIKGSRLPRIDIIGCETSVDWNVLLTRLKRVANISNINTPVFQ